jgi:hypothetical protein
LDTQRERSRDIERFGADVLAKGLAVEQFHHEKWMARFLTHVVDSANIWMIERRGGAGLALETLSCSVSSKRLETEL